MIVLLAVVLANSISFTVVAQRLPPTISTSRCLSDCLKESVHLFDISDLRNFNRIIIDTDMFCGKYTIASKCIESCSDNERAQADLLLASAGYVCVEKIEELNLVRECISRQPEDVVIGCSRQFCALNADEPIRLDHSPSSVINPFAFFEQIGPVCSKIKCSIRCSISELNNRCAGSGDIFRDIAYDQVLEASARLDRQLNNASSPLAEQLAKIYKDAMPHDCSYLIDPQAFANAFVVDLDKINVSSSIDTALVTVATVDEAKPTGDNEDDYTETIAHIDVPIVVPATDQIHTEGQLDATSESKVVDEVPPIDEKPEEAILPTANAPDVIKGEVEVQPSIDENIPPTDMVHHHHEHSSDSDAAAEETESDQNSDENISNNATTTTLIDHADNSSIPTMVDDNSETSDEKSSVVPNLFGFPFEPPTSYHRSNMSTEEDVEEPPERTIHIIDDHNQQPPSLIPNEIDPPMYTTIDDDENSDETWTTTQSSTTVADLDLQVAQPQSDLKTVGSTGVGASLSCVLLIAMLSAAMLIY